MKTTVELDDALLKAARRRAIDENTTLRALVEEGLRMRLAENESNQNADTEPVAKESPEEFYARWQQIVAASREGVEMPDAPIHPEQWRGDLDNERLEKLQSDWDGSVARRRERAKSGP